MARNGIDNWSKLRTVVNFTSLRSCASTDTPVTMPLGSTMPSPVTPSSGMMYGNSSSALRRIGRSARGGRSVNRFAVVIVAMSRSISATELPEAYDAPTMEPMLVPTITSTGTRSSSSTFSTPTCAAPRAPPPDSTSPIFGRAACWIAGATCDDWDAVCAKAGSEAAKSRQPNRCAVRAVMESGSIRASSWPGLMPGSDASVRALNCGARTPPSPGHLLTGIVNSGPLLDAASGQRCITDL